MFSSKKNRSWYLVVVWALVFAGFIFTVSRFFLHVVDKQARSKADNASTEEMFV
jgi:hypothetical protein